MLPPAYCCEVYKGESPLCEAVREHVVDEILVGTARSESRTDRSPQWKTSWKVSQTFPYTVFCLFGLA